MKNFFKNNKIYLALLIYAIVLGMAGFFIARPMILGIKDKNNKIQEKITDQDIRAEKLKNLPVIRNQFEMIKNQDKDISISLNRGNVVGLIEKLEKISNDTGNKIKIELFDDQGDKKKTSNAKKGKEEVDLSKDLPSDQYLNMNINLLGKYSNFLSFLRKLENMEYYSDVVSISLASSKGNSSFSANPFQENLSNDEADPVENEGDIYSIIRVVFYLEK